MTWFFALFLVSGFCAILYEMVWLRLAMAQFSVTTAFVSIVLSVFMLGLGAGSWLAGRLTSAGKRGAGVRALRLYAAAEFLVGLSALLVPLELVWGRALLERANAILSLSPGGFYTGAGIAMAMILTPWCACMGSTFPFAMAAIEARFPEKSGRSFSYLYLANVSGAVLGSMIPLLFIELWGFRGALRAGVALNLALALTALALSRRGTPAPAAAPIAFEEPRAEPPVSPRTCLWLLFATGLTTMAVEVVWVRVYTAYLGTVVYAFAAILGSYLAATYAGSKLYRAKPAWGRSWQAVSLLLGLCVLLPLFACDPRRAFPAALRILLGIVPFSATAGFLTPLLLDRYSRGNPSRAGWAYAVNVVGCVAGPLIAGFVLLPLIGERVSLLLTALAWIAASAIPWGVAANRPAVWKPVAAAVAAVLLLLFTRGYENAYSPRRVLRDHTATVVAGGRGFERQLLVNGVGMTSLTPITKVMAHLPLASLDHAPQSAAAICFGMGTTHRALLTWGIRSTAVELAPSVPRMFSYFHEDGDRLLQSPRSRVVIDDGRFFLERTSERFDVILIDPPPPVEAAASSLLYSKEFYGAARPRLAAGGILAQWLPPADLASQASVAKALRDSFPYVRCFGSIEGPGWHFFASETPIPRLPAAALAAKLPPAAAADLVEWGPETTAEAQFARVLAREIPLERVIAQAPDVPAMTDGHPVNEYFHLRRLRQ